VTKQDAEAVETVFPNHVAVGDRFAALFAILVGHQEGDCALSA
jgi:hypothetical protein